MARRARLSAVLALALLHSAPAWAADSGGLTEEHRLDARGAPRIVLFVLRGDGIPIKLNAFQERARKTVEGHLFGQLVSMEEVFVSAGSEFQHRLEDCRGDDRCYAGLADTVQANFLLVVTIRRVGAQIAVGSRLIDLNDARAIGNAVDLVPEGQDPLEALPERIKASIPADLWDPFGSLKVAVDLDGTEVSINGRLVGVAPVAPIGSLMPGTYRVVAARGDLFTESSVEVRRGLEAKVALELKKKVDAASGSSLSWLWWSLGAVAVVGAGVGVAMLVAGGSPSLCSAPAGGCK